MTPTTDDGLDDLTPHQLIAEIKQIAEQYDREVTTARRTWPNSVRDRVLALARFGMPRSRIGKECGIPAATVFLWCKQVPGRKRGTTTEPREVLGQARFLALRGSDMRNSNPTVGIGIEVVDPQNHGSGGVGRGAGEFFAFPGTSRAAWRRRIHDPLLYFAARARNPTLLGRVDDGPLWRDERI